MKTYLKLYFFQYLLLFFCLSLPAMTLYLIPLVPFLSILFLAIYQYVRYYHHKLNEETLKFHTTISLIVLIALTISLIFSRGYLSSPAWILFYITAIPFAPYLFGVIFIGDYMVCFLSIVLILFSNILFISFYLKPVHYIKKICLIILIAVIGMGGNNFLYQNSQSQRYKGGHDFEYMNGYSSTDLSNYTPYATNSKLVTLKEPSSFIIENEADMPILDGAEACYPVYSAIAKAVYKDIDSLERQYQIDYQYTNGKIVTFTNTSIGYSRLFNGEIDMFFGAKPSASQLEEAKSSGVELEYTPIGKEAFVFFVNQKNPIDNLSTQQIKDIYHGSITNWKEVGGHNHNISAFQRPERSGGQAMMNYFMGDTSLKEPLTYEMLSGMGGIINEVAQYYNEDGAIGYTFKYFLEGLHQEDHVKILSVDGVYPTSENIKDKTYPISTYLYCVTLKSNQKENVKKLKNYSLSNQGQYIIEKTGYCSLK